MYLYLNLYLYLCLYLWFQSYIGIFLVRERVCLLLYLCFIKKKLLLLYHNLLHKCSILCIMVSTQEEKEFCISVYFYIFPMGLQIFIGISNISIYLKKTEMHDRCLQISRSGWKYAWNTMKLYRNAQKYRKTHFLSIVLTCKKP